VAGNFIGVNFHDFIRDGDGWETISAELKYGNPYLQVFAAQVKTPTRPQGCTWTIVHRKAAVVIAPMTTDGEFVLVRQERVPIHATIWEFPAGQIDGSTEHDAQSVRDTGLRELHEEAGYELAPGGEFISLGHFFPSCGFTDEHSHMFLARPVVPMPRGNKPDESEAITECRAFAREQIRAMIASGEICDANTLAAYARMCAMGIV
jgi:ADP-ribose pyrophosphatase